MLFLVSNDEDDGKEKPYLFESDIAITDFPEDGTTAEEASIGDRVLKRSLRRSQEYLWIDRVVPYEFASDVGKKNYRFF